MVDQADKFGAEFQAGEVAKADLTAHPFTLHLGGEEICTRTLIVASGASARWLGLPSEQALIGHGVSSCATCDGFFFNGKEVVVIGGGDSAMEEALFLTRFASKVTVIHRREQFRASKFMLERARNNAKIHFITNETVDEIYDPDKQEVTGLKLRNVHSGHTHTFATDGVFLGIGHVPNTRAFVGQLDMDADGYLKTRDYVFTGVPGVFACGDVQDRRYRQAITAAGSGCMAAMEAERFLEEHGAR